MSESDVCLHRPVLENPDIPEKRKFKGLGIGDFRCQPTEMDTRIWILQVKKKKINNIVSIRNR